MNRLSWVVAVWAHVALAVFKCNTVAGAISFGEGDKAVDRDTMLSQENDKLSLDQDDRVKNLFNSIGTFKDEKEIDGLIDSELATVVDEELDATDPTDLEAIRKKMRRNKITDILVACFFFVAAVWLLLATAYSIILLVLLRLQARGELDIYDENLGRVVLCNGRITLHFGCILKRYAVQLEEDYQRQLQRRFGDSNGDNEEPQRIRIMTREERRKAVEALLGSSAKALDIESGGAADQNVCKSAHGRTKDEKASKASSLDKSLCSDEEHVCSICLTDYHPNDLVFRSKSCPHMFHRECLFSWLERRNNTECPVCREPLVSDDAIWETVQKMRKERRKILRKENGLVHRFVNWSKRRLSDQNIQTQQTLSRAETGVSDSSTSLGSRSDDENTLDQGSLPSIEINCDVVGGTPNAVGDEILTTENNESDNLSEENNVE